MASVILKNINKIYPNGVQAVFDFNLEIKDKEFIVLVGPSGCGKSTTLRMIAGLEEISSGELLIDGVLMNDVAPKDREIAMVFQSYALYPHMTVYDNMAFGLMLRRMSKEEIKKVVHETAKILGLSSYLDRKPAALSGGQRQRVALGRAIARHAKVFLMDEPLSNLDAKLRVQMRAELTRLHNQLGATTIYVTHDQIEAMTMASRIVIMRDGYVQQIDVPKVIYDKPANMFVAGFMGTPPTNFIEGKLDKEGYFVSSKKSIKVKLPEEKLKMIEKYLGKSVVLGIRPENITDNSKIIAANPETNVEIKLDIAELLGAETNLYATIDGSSICASINARGDLKMGDKVTLNFDMSTCHIFDTNTEKCLTNVK